MLATYKFYDNKGKRLAIFAEDSKTEGQLDITIIPCSKNDQFSKKRAKELLADKSAYKQTATCPIVDGKSGQSFINWCRENFSYKILVEIVMTDYYLVDKLEHELLKIAK